MQSNPNHVLRSPSLPAAGLALCTAVSLCGGAWAQDGSAEPAGQPRWEVGAFAGGISTPAYPASSERNQRAAALPFFIYRGEVLRADRDGMGARMLRTDRYEFDVGFAASLPASSNDVALRQGMPDLGTLFEFGPRLKIKLGEPAAGQRATFELPLRAVLEFGGGVRQVGYALEPKLSYAWQQKGDWYLSSSASLVVGDQQLNQYFYGVPASNANPGRPAFEAQSGLISSRLTVSGSKKLSPNVALFAFARYDLHDGAANRNSPLFAQNQGTSYGVGLTWTLARSQERAADSGR